MSDPEKSESPVAMSQYTPPRNSSAKEPYSVSVQSPESSGSQSDSDHDDGPLAVSITHTSRRSATRTVTRMTTQGTTFTSDPRYEVDFEVDDPEDPRNFPFWYKSLAIFAIAYGCLVVVMYSTSYTSALGAMQKEFGVKSETVATLGVTTYLLGLAVGSLFLAPIAETYGRRPVYAICMIFYTILILPTALAHNMESIIIVRFFGALFGSAMIANAPGTITDIVSDKHRAVAFSIWSIGPMNGPVVGPTIGGFVTEYLGWRWTNWIAMIWAGTAWILLATYKETYAPVLLQKKAQQLRKEHNDDRYWSRYDMRVGFVRLMKINLSRPFIMAATEPICIFWNVYISLIYGILYLCFVAYPIVFTQERGWSTGISGLSFLGIGIGTMIVICSAPLIQKLIDSHEPDKDGKVPPEAMMSVVCLASLLAPIGQLWFAWTCYPTSIHWAIPIAAGIPFGMGNGLVFIYAGNYLAYSYGIYAASAMAGNAVTRSVMGATLPLAGDSLYRALGPNWAGTLLGLLEVVIIPIPFLFYRYGGRIREKSTMIREMRENEERQAWKRKKGEDRLRIAVLSGDDAETQEAQVELHRIRTRMDEDVDVEARGHETLNSIHGLAQETG